MESARSSRTCTLNDIDSFFIITPSFFVKYDTESKNRMDRRGEFSRYTTSNNLQRLLKSSKFRANKEFLFVEKADRGGRRQAMSVSPKRRVRTIDYGELGVPFEHTKRCKTADGSGAGAGAGAVRGPLVTLDHNLPPVLLPVGFGGGQAAAAALSSPGTERVVVGKGGEQPPLSPSKRGPSVDSYLSLVRTNSTVNRAELDEKRRPESPQVSPRKRRDGSWASMSMFDIYADSRPGSKSKSRPTSSKRDTTPADTVLAKVNEALSAATDPLLENVPPPQNRPSARGPRRYLHELSAKAFPGYAAHSVTSSTPTYELTTPWYENEQARICFEPVSGRTRVPMTVSPPRRRPTSAETRAYMHHHRGGLGVTPPKQKWESTPFEIYEDGNEDGDTQQQKHAAVMTVENLPLAELDLDEEKENVFAK